MYVFAKRTQWDVFSRHHVIFSIYLPWAIEVRHVPCVEVNFSLVVV
jgi:hypothetical protein